MTSTQTLLLLRHGTAEDSRPGHRDFDRRLTERGRDEAAGVGAFLRDRGIAVDVVLCSPATRTRQTLEQLDLIGPTRDGPRLELVPTLYQAGAENVLELVAPLEVPTVLVIGHAPALPALVYDLADPDRSSARAIAAIASGFPPGTLARLSIQRDPAASTATLDGVRIPRATAGQYYE